MNKTLILLLVSMFLLFSLAPTTFAQQGGGNFSTTLISPSQKENTITLSWTPFPTREQNWLFNGYEVFCSESPSGGWQSCKYVGHSQVNVTIISGLSPNTTYYFKVVPHGFDSYGHSGFPESNILEVRTKPATTLSPPVTPSPTPNTYGSRVFMVDTFTPIPLLAVFCSPSKKISWIK